MDLKFDLPIILENSRLRLEPLEQIHFEHLLPLALREPDLLKYSPSLFGTKENLQEYFDFAAAQKLDERRYAFAIFDKLKEKYAGSTSMGEVSNKDLRLQVGWTWISEEFRGTGLNRQCKFLMLSYIFEILNFERVEFFTDARNDRSKKAITSIGAKLEGELRSHTVLPDGHRRNTLIYGIIKPEWEEIKSMLSSRL